MYYLQKNSRGQKYNLTPQKSTENKTDETKKGPNENEKAYKETLTKRRKMTQRTKHLNSRTETTKQIDKMN